MPSWIKQSSVRATSYVSLTVPHFVAVDHILSSSTMIATIPERYAMARIKPFALRYVPHPLPEININLFWHARFNEDPANKRLRDLVFETVADGKGHGIPTAHRMHHQHNG